MVRHSHASRCSITLGADALEIVDDGTAIAAFDTGNGLAGLRERVEGAGGTFDAGAIAPIGFRLRVSMPARRGGSDGPAATNGGASRTSASA